MAHENIPKATQTNQPSSPSVPHLRRSLTPPRTAPPPPPCQRIATLPKRKCLSISNPSLPRHNRRPFPLIPTLSPVGPAVRGPVLRVPARRRAAVAPLPPLPVGAALPSLGPARGRLRAAGRDALPQRPAAPAAQHGVPWLRGSRPRRDRGQRPEPPARPTCSWPCRAGSSGGRT